MSGVRKKASPRPNLGQIAYDEIKTMILAGELEPGGRIVLDELSQRLNLSVTPIRDALNKLAQEDLVVITPRTSHSVVKIDAKDAADILDLRLLLEVYALQTAGAALADFPAEKFRKLFSRQSSSDNSREFVKADRQFHAAILELSPNQRLPRLYSYLQNLIQVISVQALKAEGRMGDANREHLELVEAIAKGDVDFAIIRLREHFAEMRAALLRTAP